MYSWRLLIPTDAIEQTLKKGVEYHTVELTMQKSLPLNISFSGKRISFQFDFCPYQCMLKMHYAYIIILKRH